MIGTLEQTEGQAIFPVGQCQQIVSHGEVLYDCCGGNLLDDLGPEFPSGANRQLRFVSPNTGISKFKIIVNEETKLPEFIKCICLHNTEHLAKDDSSN